MKPEKTGHRKRCFSCGLVSLLLFCAEFLTPPSVNCEERGGRGNQLRAFYIVGMATSDDRRYWFDYILDAQPHDGDVRVKYIRIASEYPDCPGFVSVKAVESNLAGTRLRTLTGHANLCSIEEKDADAAIADAKPRFLEGITESGRSESLLNVAGRKGCSACHTTKKSTCGP